MQLPHICACKKDHLPCSLQQPSGEDREEKAPPSLHTAAMQRACGNASIAVDKPPFLLCTAQTDPCSHIPRVAPASSEESDPFRKCDTISWRHYQSPLWLVDLFADEKIHFDATTDHSKSTLDYQFFAMVSNSLRLQPGASEQRLHAI